jgi:hypothetical protein
MKKRTRNILCLWIIILGVANFVSYSIVYGYIGGDAKNGEIRDGRYFVRGHFIHYRAFPEGDETEVSRRMWIYSYLHSITILPTAAAIVISTLIMTRSHIISTMREGFVSGQALITLFAAVMILIAGVVTIWFIFDFISSLTTAGK